MMLGTTEHVRVLWELYETAVAEEISLREELEELKSRVGDAYED